jgi:hypothetical protein
MSLLARRPCDLRHAAVSTWLNAGVALSHVAERSGRSVYVRTRVWFTEPWRSARCGLETRPQGWYARTVKLG